MGGLCEKWEISERAGQMLKKQETELKQQLTAICGNKKSARDVAFPEIKAQLKDLMEAVRHLHIPPVTHVLLTATALSIK